VRIFTRYILGEVTSHALLGGAIFTFVLFMRDLGPILDMVVRNSASLTDIGRTFVYVLPSFLSFTIPMAVLVGILLGLSRLAADSEITAMRAAGIGVFSFVRIVSVLAVAAWLLSLGNSLYVAPRAAGALIHLEDDLKNSQASFEVQPRVFYENFRNYVLYVQDVRAGTGASDWHRVFLADLTLPAAPRITTAEEAIVANGTAQTLHMHMEHGEQHELSSTNPDQYNVSTFAQSDLPLQTGAPEDTHIGHSDAPELALSNRELLRRSRLAGGRQYSIELNQRFSYPAACLVLMLVGVPLGISSRRGGKSTGFVLTILLVFVYYIFSYVGVALAKQNKISAGAGVWGADLLFSIAGLLLLLQMSRGSIALNAFSSMGVALGNFLRRFRGKGGPHFASAGAAPVMLVRKTLRSRFPLILDEYVMRKFAGNFLLVLITFIMLSLIFSFFELLGDIIRYRVPLVTVGDYLLNLIPYMLYQLTPLCVLIAVLITFGVLNRTSELTAMKATGISLYRVVAPVLVMSAVIAASLFLFDESYLPAANRRQESLRAIIKGKPAQTFLSPNRNWIFGEQEAGGPGRIFYYQFFDPDKNVFANLTVFEFQPDSFNLQSRTFATSAHWDQQLNQWVFENGWQRSFSGETTTGYKPFVLTTFPEIHEQPAYFKKEFRPSQEMSYSDLSDYIRDLRQMGLDTIRQRVQLNRKLAYPLIALVMAVLAVPFALSMGRRGSLTSLNPWAT